MESGCKGLKGIFGVGNSLIVLLEVCTKLVVNINDIIGKVVEETVLEHAQNNQEGLNIILFHCHFLPLKVGN
eukprot:613411-Ditylum_brightwellii.AAC.1